MRPVRMGDVPETFDRFQVSRILGRGGMGTVYLAKDQRLGRNVALKVLHAPGLAADEQRNRFKREARAAGAIRHPNVATIYEVSETDEGVPFIVMEYCEGETLAQRIRRRPLDAGEFLSIARQVAAGLDAAHTQGVIHRDIKAANVMIEPSGLVKILDFGLAKLTAREVPEEKPSYESTSSHFFGTLHYISPEQARGGPADARSDLFSLGVVLYQMSAGHLPFNGETALLTLERIRDSEPEPFTPLDPSFPLAATRVIAKLLQKAPDDRYQTARELLTDLEAIEPPTARGSMHSRSALGRTRARPHWTRYALLAAVMVIAAIVVVIIGRTNEKEIAAATQTAPAAAPQPIRTLAVLPLANLASNQKDDFLSVGLADALVTKLQRIPSVQVRPTSAVLQYRAPGTTDAKAAARALGVDGVLEGHFLAAGNLVRVNLQLTDARSGYSVWADSFDGKRSDLLQLFDNVTGQTAAGLMQRLGPQRVAPSGSEPRSSNPRAYEQYVRARALTGSFTPGAFDAQMRALKKAIELDPNFAAAYADLAIAISLGSVRGLITDPDALHKAEWYARQAVRLDPNLPDAHLALGRVFVRFPDRYREAVRENMTALRGDPNDSLALWVLTSYLVSAGEMQKMQCVSERLVRIDAGSSEAKTRGYWYLNAVDPEAAIENAKFALAAKDSEVAGHDVRGVSFVLLGNLAAAEAEAAAIARLAPASYLTSSIRAMIAASRGDRPASEAALAAFREVAERNHWAALRQAQCYAKLGERDKAIEWLGKAAQLGNHSWYSLVKHPWLQPLQSDPDFQKIVGAIKSDLDDVHDDVVGVYQLICR